MQILKRGKKLLLKLKTAFSKKRKNWKPVKKN